MKHLVPFIANKREKLSTETNRTQLFPFEMKIYA